MMRKLMKGISIVVLASTLTLVLGINSDVQAAGKKQFMSFVTSSSAGTWYFLGAGFASIWNKNIPNVRITAESTAGSEENLNLMMRGKVDMGFTSFAPIVKANEDKRDLKGTVRLICTGHTSTAHWVVPASSSIKGMGDFKGRRIGVGPTGTASIITAEKTLKTGFNISFEDFDARRLRFPEAVRALKDDTIDGTLVQAGYPVASIQELATFKKIRLISIPEDIVKKVTDKHPDIAAEVIPGGTYKGVPNDVLTVTSPAVIMTKTGISEDLVYQLTKILFENSKERNAIHPAAKIYVLEKAFNGSKKLGIPFHQGAIKYYKEKGVWHSDTDIQ